ncbi:hypothetical protein C0J52_02807 [Blattella germanica]|nr:hypothetical protein C0J52_02807 [Blattella germanica]
MRIVLPFCHFQNGSVNNEEFSAASVLARLGVTVDAHGALVRERPTSLLGGLVINNKENVMEEPKEEDEKKTTEVCRSKNVEDENSSEEDGDDGAGGDSKMTNSGTQTHQSAETSEAQNLSALYHGTWPVERTLWHSGPSSLDVETRQRAAQALHNMVHSHPDDKRGRREARVLRLLEQVREYCESLREVIDAASPADGSQEPPQPLLQAASTIDQDMLLLVLRGNDEKEVGLAGQDSSSLVIDDMERHPGPTIAALMKLSFDEEHRHAMCQLASVLRNLSWRADGASKQTLREVGAVSGLMQAAMEGKKESTLKSILSALWNLSAHCSINKVDICAVEGALGFLVDMLTYKAPSKTLAIIENAGGILRNISSHIAVREDYRYHNCLQVLLQQLKSPSLTIVSNACGTLWNLSARCAEDQRALWEMGAVSMLRSLVHSKHKMISMGSSAALKNLLSAKPNNNFPLDSTAKGLGLPALPSLYVRKQRALEQELDQTLSETCDNIEPSTSPSSSTIGLRDDKFVFSTTDHCFGSVERRHSRMFHSQGHQFQQHQSSKYHSRGAVARSDSRDSVTSTLSDTVYERVSRTVINPMTFGQTSPINGTVQGLTGSLSDSGRINSQMSGGENSDRRFLRRYCNSMREREENRKVSSLDVSNEDNTTQHQNGHDLSYQHSRLEQINETNFVEPAPSSSTPRERLAGSRQSSIENQHDSKPQNERGDGDADRLKTSSLTKQPKSLLYDSPRSAFSPLVSGSYSSSSGRTQYQHSTPQQNCMSRTKFSDFSYDDDTEVQEQPVDYSLKYVEDNTPTRESDAANTPEKDQSKPPEAVQDRSSSLEFSNPGTNNGIRGKQNQNDLGRGYPFRHPGNIHVSKNMKMNVVYGDYAETDLDQPTDYSLKYAEDEETEFEKNHQLSSRERERTDRNYYDGSDPIHEDTLKTYCTEGTPYETPYNFSTATSMSDLHCEPATPHSEDSGGKKPSENYSKEESVEDNTANKSVDDDDARNTVVTSNFDKDFEEKGPQIKALPPAPRQPLKRLQSGLSSGLLSPEKPVQYCEEGTPGCFSRVSSLSSLNSVPASVDNAQSPPVPNETSEAVLSEEQPAPKVEKSEASSGEQSEKKEVAKREGESSTTPEEAVRRPEDIKEEQHRGDREGKVVTFGGADHYAEETPLMFSRCSSLGSLSSFEQHSIHDDRSSVVSDFSELPDSPTQTVPASPRHSKPPVEFTSRLLEDSSTVRAQPVPANRLPGKGSVFEDNVVAFKEEDTPVEFSRATSLSSLTIDDEPKISNDAILKEVVGKQTAHPRPSNIPTGIHHTARLEMVGRDREEGMEKQDVEKEKRGELADCCELAPIIHVLSNLLSCNDVIFRVDRQRQCQYNKNAAAVRTHQPVGGSRFQTTPAQPSSSRTGRPSGIPVKTVPNNNMRPAAKGKQPEGTRGTTTKTLSYVEVPGGACEDAVRTYCTEGTPANISHAGSHSDLSVLSLPGDGDATEAPREESRLQGVEEAEEAAGSGSGGDRPELSDDSSNFSGDNDNILAECIQSGMPKARSQTPRRVLPQPGSFTIASPSEQPDQQQQQQPKKKAPTTTSAGGPASTHSSRRQTPTYRPPTHHLCSLDHGASSHSHSPPRAANKKPTPTGQTALSQPISEGASCDTPLRFNTEDTPLEISHAASLSSLSVGDDDEDYNAAMKPLRQSSGSAGGPLGVVTKPPSGIPVPIGHSSDGMMRTCRSPLNKLLDSEASQLMVTSDGSWGDHSDKHEDSTASSRLHNKTSSLSEDVITVLSRNGSLSSLSVDSFGSTEPTPSEQALLEQCISSGMPKSKTEAGGGKPRIAVAVSGKKKISGGVCKIPHRQGDDERQGLVIPSVPLQKLELKPIQRTRTSSSSSEPVAGSIEAGMACLSLQDDDVSSYPFDMKQIPKNGVDPSAVLLMKETAADVDESTAVIESEQNLLDQLESLEVQEKVEERETISPLARAVKLRDEAAIITNKYSVTKEVPKHLSSLPVADGKKGLDIPLDFDKSKKLESPQSTSDDNKSPFSSGESPSTDFGSDGKPEDDYRNKRDPDAMIASLDRLTEELVQQAQDLHQQKDKNKDPNVMKQSLVGSDTWNEDTSPNDVSFPSMSISAPLVASFKSDNHEDAGSTLPELAEEEDLVSKTSEEQQVSSLTDSHMIELEAGKLAVAVQAEAQNLPYTSAEDMEHSITSLNSVDLDAIKPPSMMGSLVSLTASLSGQLDKEDSGETRERCNSSSLPPQQPRSNGSTRMECRHSRKKSLPAGMMVRRAIGNNHNGSIENLQDNTSVSSSCNSHLDNIKPPSAMEELIDIADMENSMVSVASITSEVADSSTKEQSNSEQSPGNSDAMFELLKPAASVMAEVYAAQYPAATMSVSVRTSSASDCLDNINPPSAFNEIADLVDPESTMEPGTETICSDTEMCTEDPGFAQSLEKLDEVDAPDLPSDTSRKTTPVPSDHYATSSAESTPKKHKHRQMTPKQKRQLVKERYKTYTITQEEELRREIILGKQSCSDIMEAEPACGMQEVDEKESKVKTPTKITPKQRRMEDRERFQTRVLDKSPVIDKMQGIEDAVTPTDDVNVLEQLETKTHDVIRPKIPRVKTLKQKRAEAKDRFRTRTLSEENRPQQNCETNANHSENANYETAETVQATSGAEALTLNCSDVGFVEAFLNVTPEEIESLLERDANIVITTINDARRRNSESSELPSSDEMLLECETLSLISIESESDQNSNFCRVGKRRGSDHLTRGNSVNSEEPLHLTNDDVFMDANVNVKVNEQIEAEVGDSEENTDDSQDEDENAIKAAKGPRIVKPEERLRRDESADSNNTDEGTPQNSSPKGIRGRRKALYSSPAAKKPTSTPPGLPVATKSRSSIPVVSGPAKSSSTSNIRATRASALRQTGRSSSSGTSQRSISRTPPSSAESRSPRNTSPKTNRTARSQQRNQNTASPPSKTPSRNSFSSTRTVSKESEECDVKDPRFKPPERQGTFTKDDNTSSVAPKVATLQSPTKTKIPIPASVTNANVKSETKLKKPTAGTKPTPANSRSKLRKETSAPTPLTRTSMLSRFSKAHSQEGTSSKTLTKAATIPGRNGTTRSPPSSRISYKRGSVGAQDGMKTSVSNQSLQSSDSGKTTPKQGVVHPQRSNSNCSLNSVSSVAGSGKKTTTKKEVTSKIASLWKRVEESKNKQKAAKKDTRVWITAESEETNHVETENEVNGSPETPMPPSRLVRSSTFEGLPTKTASKDEAEGTAATEDPEVDMTNVRTKHIAGKCNRNSGDFTGFVGNQEFFSRLPNTQRQVAEVTGIVVVQPTTRITDHSFTKIHSETTTQEVVLRRKHKETKPNADESEDPESEKKRVSRLGSFISIDPPEGGVASNGEVKPASKLPASAIVPPFNYNPPTSHIPMPVTSIAKRSESYLSGIGNAENARHEQSETLEEQVQEFNTASMREQYIPIDIHTNKLSDWLISRRHCNREWQARILTIREKINNAIQDMPVHEGIAKLLSGSYINYFHCRKIIEILKETEASSKNFFGSYGSQRMKDWQEVVRLYEKDNVYLAEAAQMLIRNVNYEVPSLKKQIAKFEQIQMECDKKEAEYAKSGNVLRGEFQTLCKQLGIEGKKIKRELVDLLAELPGIYNKVANNVKTLDQAVQFYTEFVKFIDFGDSDGINFGNGNEIDFGDAALEGGGGGDIDWGISIESPAENQDIDFNVTLEESGIVVESSGTEGGVAKGKEALTLLDNPKTRNRFIDELMELESFLKVRLFEMKGPSNLLTLSQLQDGPSILQLQTTQSIQDMLNRVQVVRAEITDSRTQHLHNIKNSPRYVDNLANSVKQKLDLAEKMAASQKAVRQRQKEAVDCTSRNIQILYPTPSLGVT